MSDIRGRKDHFDDILKQIKLAGKYMLYILGDAVDRNPDGITLLKYIMSKHNLLILISKLFD